MTILFGGGENEFSFTNGHLDFTAGRFYPDYARCAIRPTADVGVVHDFTGDLATYLATTKDIWYGFQFSGGGGSFAFNNNVVIFYDTAGTPFFRLQCYGPNSVFALTSPDGGTTWNGYLPSVIAQPGPDPVEYTFRIKLAAGTAGKIQWWIGGALWWEFTGNTLAFASSIGRVIFGQSNANNTAWFSEIIATTGDDARVGMRLATLPVTADGSVVEWDGGFAAINEIVEDVGNSVSTGLAPKDELFVVGNLPTLGAGVVPRALIISANVQTQLGAPQNLKGALKIGSTIYRSPAKAVENTPANKQFVFSNSPATSGSLTSAEVNAAEVGISSVA